VRSNESVAEVACAVRTVTHFFVNQLDIPFAGVQTTATADAGDKLIVRMAHATPACFPLSMYSECRMGGAKRNPSSYWPHGSAMLFRREFDDGDRLRCSSNCVLFDGLRFAPPILRALLRRVGFERLVGQCDSHDIGDQRYEE
jgi:hypothetical protein